MKKHCKIMAVAGGILGLLSMLFQSWQVRYSIPLALLALALGGAVTYVIYVMWSSFAEMLERLERLEGKNFGSTADEKEWEKTGQKTDIRENAEEDTTDGRAGSFCPRCGKIQQGAAAFCVSCGMPMR